jgi:hypothetical protein
MSTSIFTERGVKRKKIKEKGENPKVLSWYYGW